LRESKRKYVLDHVEQWADELIESGGHFHGKPAKPTTAEVSCVLCIPGSDRADEVAAKLLVALLAAEGITARTLPRTQTRPPEGAAPPELIVISALPPDAVVFARHACKRARAAYPDVPIVVGLWHARGDLQRSRQRLEPAGVSRIVTTFAGCVSQIQSGILTRKDTEPTLLPAPEPTPSLEVSPRGRTSA
jgi:hypothetical protein